MNGESWTIFYFGGRTVSSEILKPGEVFDTHGNRGLLLGNDLHALHVGPDRSNPEELTFFWEHVETVGPAPAAREGTQMVRDAAPSPRYLQVQRFHTDIEL